MAFDATLCCHVQRNLARKVAELEEEDAKLRLQEMAARQAGGMRSRLSPFACRPLGRAVLCVLTLALATPHTLSAQRRASEGHLQGDAGLPHAPASHRRGKASCSAHQ
jgi:hypothetical protein